MDWETKVKVLSLLTEYNLSKSIKNAHALAKVVPLLMEYIDSLEGDRRKYVSFASQVDEKDRLWKNDGGVWMKKAEAELAWTRSSAPFAMFDKFSESEDD